MTRAEVDAWAEASEIPVFCADGLDDAILGIGQRFNRYFVVYDVTQVIAILMRDGMDYEGAVEWFEFNIVGAWVGNPDDPNEPDGPPCFLMSSVP